MKVNLRDLFWLVLVAAVLTMWWMDHAQLTDRLSFYETPPPATAAVPVTGVVVATNSNDLVEVSIGSDDGVKTGQAMELSRGNQRLGKIIIRAVSPDRAVGQIDKPSNRAKIQKGDTVTTNIKLVGVQR